MNKQWTELNKNMQLNIKKKDTFHGGIDTLITFISSFLKVIRVSIPP